MQNPDRVRAAHVHGEVDEKNHLSGSHTLFACSQTFVRGLPDRILAVTQPLLGSRIRRRPWLGVSLNFWLYQRLKAPREA